MKRDQMLELLAGVLDDLGVDDSYEDNLVKADVILVELEEAGMAYINDNYEQGWKPE